MVSMRRTVVLLSLVSAPLLSQESGARILPLSLPDTQSIRCEPHASDITGVIGFRFEIGNSLQGQWRQFTAEYLPDGTAVSLQVMEALPIEGGTATVL